jgi:hypothetical protein
LQGPAADLLMQGVTDWKDNAELNPSFCVQYTKLAAEKASRISTASFFAIWL